MESVLTARTAILLELRHGPACGLDLIERIARRGGVPPSEGTVYPLLDRLEGEDLVRRLGPRPHRTRGRARIDFELTVAGVVAADAVRQVIRATLQERHFSPPDDAREERMRERVQTSLALSRFAARLRSRLQRGAQP